MEINNDLNNNTPNICLGNLQKDYLTRAADWSYFLGILGFMGLGVNILSLFFVNSIFSSLLNGIRFPSTISWFSGFGIMGLIGLIIEFYLAFYLFNFGKKTKLALNTDDSEMLTVGLKSLYSFLWLTGVLAIIGLIFTLLTLLFGSFAFMAL